MVAIQFFAPGHAFAIMAPMAGFLRAATKGLIAPPRPAFADHPPGAPHRPGIYTRGAGPDLYCCLSSWSVGFRTAFRGGLFLLLSVSSAGATHLWAQSATAREEENLAQAQAAYAHKDYKQAQAVLESILAVSPHSFAANEMMGLVVNELANPGSAEPFFEAAVSADSSSALAHENLAANLSRLHKNALAEKEFQKALNLDPHNYDLNHNLGEFYASRDQVARAVPFLKAAQNLRPDSYSNGYDLALAEMEAGMLDDSQAQIGALLKIQDSAELHSLLGDVDERKGQFLDAANELQRAAVLDPSEDNVFAWGAELIRHRTLDPAVEVFRHGAQLYPNSWTMQIGLGVPLYLLGRSQEAVEAFCRAIDLNPADSRPYFFLAKVHGIPPQQAAQVAERFERYVKAQPKSAEARFDFAMNLWDSSNQQAEPTDTVKVKSLLREAAALDPKFADAHLQLGILYAKEGDNAAALAEYQRAVALDPGLEIAHYRLALALIHAGQTERGKQELATWNRVKSNQQEEDEKKQKQILQFIYGPPGSEKSMP
jgi:tetratricopeptide (TPR) repeat protein